MKCLWNSETYSGRQWTNILPTITTSAGHRSIITQAVLLLYLFCVVYTYEIENQWTRGVCCLHVIMKIYTEPAKMKIIIHRMKISLGLSLKIYWCELICRFITLLNNWDGQQTFFSHGPRHKHVLWAVCYLGQHVCDSRDVIGQFSGPATPEPIKTPLGHSPLLPVGVLAGWAAS